MYKYLVLFIPLLILYPILGLLPVFVYYAFYFYNCGEPKLYYSEDNEEIKRKMSVFKERFIPCSLAVSFSFQTFMDKWWPHSVNNKEIVFEGEDGGEFVVDVSSGNFDKHTILIHGLGSSSKVGYIKDLSMVLDERGYKVFSLNMRGATRPLKSPKFFHVGWTEDLKSLVNYILKNYTGDIYLIGFSLGGCWVAKFLSEIEDKPEYHRVKKGVIISSPMVSPEKLSLNLSYFMIVVDYFLTSKIKSLILENPIVYKYCNMTKQEVESLIRMKQIEEQIITKVFGYESKEEYYISNDIEEYITRIKKPLLAISSEDDPLGQISEKIKQEALRNKLFAIILSKRGGHLGFYGNDLSQSYLHRIISMFLKS